MKFNCICEAFQLDHGISCEAPFVVPSGARECPPAVKWHTEESKALISLAGKGRSKTPEHKERIRQASLKERQYKRDNGIPFAGCSPERAREWMLANPDRIYTPERNAKMAATKTGTKRQYRPDGTFYMVKVQIDQ